MGRACSVSVWCCVGLVLCWFGVVLTWCYVGLVLFWFGVVLVLVLFGFGVVSVWYCLGSVLCWFGIVWVWCCVGSVLFGFGVVLVWYCLGSVLCWFGTVWVWRCCAGLVCCRFGFGVAVLIWCCVGLVLLCSLMRIGLLTFRVFIRHKPSSRTMPTLLHESGCLRLATRQHKPCPLILQHTFRETSLARHSHSHTLHSSIHSSCSGLFWVTFSFIS